jgi:hypothetical protein
MPRSTRPEPARTRGDSIVADAMVRAQRIQHAIQYPGSNEFEKYPLRSTSAKRFGPCRGA